MSAQYSYDDMYAIAKFEYDAEIMQRWLYSEKANFACLKFIRSMQKRIVKIINQ